MVPEESTSRELWAASTLDLIDLDLIDLDTECTDDIKEKEQASTDESGSRDVQNSSKYAVDIWSSMGDPIGVAFDEKGVVGLSPDYVAGDPQLLQPLRAPDGRWSCNKDDVAECGRHCLIERRSETRTRVYRNEWIVKRIYLEWIRVKPPWVANVDYCEGSSSKQQGYVGTCWAVTRSQDEFLNTERSSPIELVSSLNGI